MNIMAAFKPGERFVERMDWAKPVATSWQGPTSEDVRFYSIISADFEKRQYNVWQYLKVNGAQPPLTSCSVCAGKGRVFVNWRPEAPCEKQTIAFEYAHKNFSRCLSNFVLL